MKGLVFLAILFVSATCQDVSTTSESSVSLPSVPTSDELLATTPLPTVNSVENIAQVIPEEVKEGKYHSCTACPFESDHHKCNDPFKLSKKFEVSADMCNKINTDKRQVDILCKRYPKGYFFQCPKGGSSYTCKASCGVRVEDVGKGLLDADIKDMPGGLLSGLGFNNHISGPPSKNQPQGIGLLNNMGDIFHSVQQPGAPHIPVPSHQLHPPSQQHPNPIHPNTFAGPHNAYPGPNPLFQQHQNTPMMMPFHPPNNNPFVSQVPVQPHHHVFTGFTGFGAPDHGAQPHTSFPHPPPAPQKVTIPVPPSPKANAQIPLSSAHQVLGGFTGFPTQNPNYQPHTSLPQPLSASPKAIMPAPPSPKAAIEISTVPTIPTVTSNPLNQESLNMGIQDAEPKVQPASIQTNNAPKNPSKVAQTNKAVQDLINAGSQHQPTGNVGKHAPQNANNFGFGLFGQQPNHRSPFDHHANFFQTPMQPMNNFGGSGFLNKPVQGSASKATQNLHSFMGGFDDFNNGFHQFASGIAQSPPKKASPVQSNGGSFFSNLFGFKKR